MQSLDGARRLRSTANFLRNLVPTAACAISSETASNSKALTPAPNSKALTQAPSPSCPRPSGPGFAGVRKNLRPGAGENFNYFNAAERELRMGNCSICQHDRRHLIEIGLVHRVPRRVLAKRFSVSPDALWRHDLPPQARAAKQHDELTAFHSITSLARASSVGGTLSPIAFAVLRLITNSNLVGCSTGRSAGLAPLSILST
jgi:hypothetical protein